MSAVVTNADEGLGAIANAVGAEALSTDPQELDYLGHDVFSRGAPLLAVFRPKDKQMLARGIAAATRHGIALVPRGGGMSYTGGYLASVPGALLIDLSAMNRVLEVNAIDMTATVEAGCTWATLREALKPHGLRALAWGTLSGLKATIGGSMSQNAVFWGARDGVIADGALRFEVVLADGRLISTGSGFFRSFGPDLTGLFAADTGALGIKATVTLQLVREGAALGYGSYSFDTAEGFFRAMSGVAREGLAAENFGFDPFLQAQRMKRDSLSADARSLVNMMKSKGSAWKGLKEGAKVVAAGRSFLEAGSFSLHVVCERHHESAVTADLATIDQLMLEAGGKAVENTIPKVLRANPFPPVNSMVGPAGERWVPVHGLLPHSRLLEGWRRLQEHFAGRQEDMERLGVGVGSLFAAVSPSVCLIEPVFYWPDALEEVHRRSLEPAHLAKLRQYPPSEAARSLVTELRGGVIDIFRGLDAAHLQIARAYPLRQASHPAAWELLLAVKRAVDPSNLMNPGSLGL